MDKKRRRHGSRGSFGVLIYVHFIGWIRRGDVDFMRLKVLKLQLLQLREWVLLGVGDHVLLVEENGVQTVGDRLGTLQKMVISNNGKLMASFTHDGQLLVMPTDFSTIIFEYSCEDDMLLMVGPYGDPVCYLYDEPIILIPECDGDRILSNLNMEFLQWVPTSTKSIFKIRSTEPTTLLYDALDHFDRRNAKVDENLRLIKTSLPEAVEICVDAARHEFDHFDRRNAKVISECPQAKMTIEEQKVSLGETHAELVKRLDDGIYSPFSLFFYTFSAE
ncbi:unnamed protein product [Lactuca saligna]|uniref:Vps16 N-terminal domain-containing protein n=1 Tax=Lactuca saligna TaxID=75948 RepID=A0AA35Y5B3_LACSI|nr:unnamed protein product [Lactuca saligna]